LQYIITHPLQLILLIGYLITLQAYSNIIHNLNHRVQFLVNVLHICTKIFKFSKHVCDLLTLFKIFISASILTVSLPILFKAHLPRCHLRLKTPHLLYESIELLRLHLVLHDRKYRITHLCNISRFSSEL